MAFQKIAKLITTKDPDRNKIYSDHNLNEFKTFPIQAKLKVRPLNDIPTRHKI